MSGDMDGKKALDVKRYHMSILMFWTRDFMIEKLEQVQTGYQMYISCIMQGHSSNWHIEIGNTAIVRFIRFICTCIVSLCSLVGAAFITRSTLRRGTPVIANI
jgi:hypothetical protein